MADDDLHGLRVLVVEDEGLILLTIEDVLRDLGCEIVGTASGAEAALAILAGAHVDAALLDVNLGAGRNSFPVAAELASRGIPFVFLTGYGPEGLPRDFRGRPVLAKPVDERRLEASLRALRSVLPARGL